MFAMKFVPSFFIITSVRVSTISKRERGSHWPQISTGAHCWPDRKTTIDGKRKIIGRRLSSSISVPSKGRD